jgi:hypothetical protein
MPMPNFGNVAARVQLEIGDQLLGERTAHALADQRVFAVQFHAAGKHRARRAVALDTHVAGRHALHRTVVVVEHFGGGEAGIDLDAQRLGAACQPAAHIAERDDVVAVIVHQRRHQEIRQANRAGRSEEQELVSLTGVLNGWSGSSRQSEISLSMPIGSTTAPGEDMRADLGALFEHNHRQFRIGLLQPDRGGRPAGPAPTITTSNSMLSRSIHISHRTSSPL